MESKTYKLYSAQYCLMVEALRRWVAFHRDRELEALESAWLGLGTYSYYKPALDAGLMTCATAPNPRYYLTWWKLTPKGAAIMKAWIAGGYTGYGYGGYDSPPRSGELQGEDDD